MVWFLFPADKFMVPRVYGTHSRYAELCSGRAPPTFRTNSVQEMQSLQALNIA